MSTKRFLVIFSCVLIFLSLCVFTFISNKYMNDYFSDYIDEEYLHNVENINEYAKLNILEGHQPRSVLNSYVKDPIYYVEIYDTDGNLVIYSGMMMGNKFTFDEETMIVDSFSVYDGQKLIGEILISRELQTDNTLTNQLFKRALTIGAIVSLLVTIFVIGIILVFLIRFISKNVNNVVEYANNDSIEPKKFSIRELNTIVNAIKEYRIKLSIKEKVKKQKFDKLLHETKTPITIIKSQLEGVTDGIIEFDKQRATSMIGEVNNLDVLLKDIINIVEGNFVENKIEFEEVDYSAELEKIAKSLCAKFKKKKLELKLENENFIINTNKELLNNVIYNLLINSYKYTKEGIVTVTVNNSEKTILIKDSGIGIDEDDIKNIFRPYYRGKNAKVVKGEGLGLANAKESIEKLGAEIKVSSQLGKFTQFKIYF